MRTGGNVTIEQREWTRLLAWEGCLNARDLGGYATTDGRETRWGVVVRSDSPAALTEAGRAALADYGVRAIVDLRLPAELADHPNPFAEPGDHGIAYTNVSFIDPAAAPPNAATTLAEDYLEMLDRYWAGVAEAVAAIAGAPEGAVVIHCAAGKDRTGLISALLLGLVGVPAETIAADYAMTAELLRSREQAWLDSCPPEERAEREAMIARYAPTAEVMREVLAGLDERHGGVEAYLLEAGVSRDDLDRLRHRLLAPGG
jgi:protein-tyrosine phosphatase